ncbi:phospholipase C/P1 nuclease family protein [Endozoicomonas numazuensis]|uniref:Uncharacterized protein n=1 Tax=Endozoicomonas numazuensis TaxID=1137799 RepID=A0A081NEW0_9GAMM|nr:hypothetical protein [Endozoicomonas numazuensis]KEQ16983.1 hypothetical protein GZ78_20395 [Endozoicomonas numazuensis]
MISSWIAWQNMTPTARQRAQELLDILKEAEPKTHSFVIASTWMDSIKKEGLAVTRYWHTVSDQKDTHPENRARKRINVQRAVVFNQIEPEVPLSKKYLLRGQIISRERIVTSGYRLSQTLNQVLNQ